MNGLNGILWFFCRSTFIIQLKFSEIKMWYIFKLFDIDIEVFDFELWTQLKTKSETIEIAIWAEWIRKWNQFSYCVESRKVLRSKNVTVISYLFIYKCFYFFLVFIKSLALFLVCVSILISNPCLQKKQKGSQISIACSECSWYIYNILCYENWW